MRNKSVFILLLFTIHSFLTVAQENKSILTAPDNWQSELIPFPISFAPSIDYQGIEDLRFAPGWADTASNQFWTYTFFWYLDKYYPLTSGGLSTTLETYFDGLMGINAEKAADSVLKKKTAVVLVKNKKGFDGTVLVYDAFFTKKMMLLHVKVKETFCTATKKHLIRFRFSPKAFNDPVWDVFNEVKLNVKCE